MSNESLHDDRRRSGRMARDLLIQVSGTDANGKSFVSRAKTLLLSRYGAEILLEQPLAPEQEINVTCEGIMTGEGARVVKLLKREADGYSYGIEFLRTAEDFWKTQFPPD